MSDANPDNARAAETAKPNGLNYAHSQPSRLRRWARDTFTREQMVSGLKQLAWVAPLTMLIWVYAEREQQVQARDIRFNVEVRSNNPRVAVHLVDPADGTVSVDLRGPRNQVDSLRSDLGSRSSAVRFEVPADLKEGTHQIPITAVVNRDARFEGTSVLNNPVPRVTVLVDPIDEASVEVQVRDEDKGVIDAAVFTPQKVKVRMPRTTMTSAREKSPGGKLAVYADLAALPDRTPGRKTDVSGVRVYVANADASEVVIDPPTVTASFEAREQAQVYPIPEVPILEMPATQLRELVTVKLERVNLFDVRVVGPPAAIAEIERNKGAGVKALVSIDADDRDQGPRRKDITFWTPEGVKIHPDDAKQTVEVTVTTRSSAP
jgi:hypothetical protein